MKLRNVVVALSAVLIGTAAPGFAQAARAGAGTAEAATTVAAIRVVITAAGMATEGIPGVTAVSASALASACWARP